MYIQYIRSCFIACVYMYIIICIYVVYCMHVLVKCWLVVHSKRYVEIGRGERRGGWEGSNKQRWEDREIGIYIYTHCKSGNVDYLYFSILPNFHLLTAIMLFIFFNVHTISTTKYFLQTLIKLSIVYTHWFGHIPTFLALCHSEPSLPPTCLEWSNFPSKIHCLDPQFAHTIYNHYTILWPISLSLSFCS